MSQSAPDLDELAVLREQLRGEIVCTPTIRCAGLEDQLGGSMRIYGKLEFLQRTGTFKARGALATVRSLSEEQRKAGVTAVSAGNHAIATAYAARISGTTAKVVMTASANPYRVAASRGYGAEVVIVNDVHEAFRVADKIQTDEGRYFVHPFEGRQVALGTGTIGLELAEQIEAPDAILIAVGGGGLIGGLGNAIKQLWPRTEVIGVEPEGADSMSRSLAAGKPEAIDAVRTIADSLGAPYACPWSFKLCQDNIDRMVLVSDEQLRGAMGLLFQHMKIAVEPACAATTAALLGPLAESLAGRRVLLVFCGSNIDWATFRSQVRD